MTEKPIEVLQQAVRIEAIRRVKWVYSMAEEGYGSGSLGLPADALDRDLIALGVTQAELAEAALRDYQP